MVAVGLNTSNHLKVIVQRIAKLSCFCLRQTVVLLSTVLHLLRVYLLRVYLI